MMKFVVFICILNYMEHPLSSAAVECTSERLFKSKRAH